MPRSGLFLRLAGPTLLMSVLLFCACVGMALYLDDRQARAVEILSESIETRQFARLLDEGLDDLMAAVLDGTDPVRIPVGRVRDRIDAAGILGQEISTTIHPRFGDLQGLDLQMQYVADEIKRLLETLQQREREVRRADQLAVVGQIAAGLAHEIRNPLTLVEMLVQVNGEEAEARGQPAEDFRAMEQEIRRIERRVQTLLDFARPPRPERRRTDLRELARSALALVAGRASRQQVALRPVETGAPVLVEPDAEQVRQVLVNLLLNALDVMPRGGTLEIGLSHAHEAQPVSLRVRDTGPGIPPQVLPRLGQPFVSGKESGLGLGLAISRRIAEDHGGRLEGTNHPERGTKFTLFLPPAPAETP